MLTLKTKFQLTESDTEQGHFVGLATMFGSVIEAFVPTLIQPGAFTKTLREGRDRIKLLWQHDRDKPIGLPIALAETSAGLEVTGRLSMTQQGREALMLMRDGVLDALSIGFDAIVEELQKDSRGNVTRILKEIKLWEISLVTWGADPNARILEVYSAQPFTDLPVAPPQTPWDPDAAEARVRAWAGATEAPNDRYCRAFAWVDRRAAEAFEAHRLPIADVIAGELVIVPAALDIVQAALPALPPDDRPRLQETLSRYREKATHLIDDTCAQLATMTGRLPSLTHEGRVLSDKNKTLLEAALAALSALLQAAAPPPPPDASDDAEAQARTAARLDQLRAAELSYADVLSR
jgi:HK97 family phage prohead protease